MQVGVCMDMRFRLALSQAQGYDLVAWMIPRKIVGSSVQNKVLLDNVEVKWKGKERNILDTIFSDSACNPA